MIAFEKWLWRVRFKIFFEIQKCTKKIMISVKEYFWSEIELLSYGTLNSQFSSAYLTSYAQKHEELRFFQFFLKKVKDSILGPPNLFLMIPKAKMNIPWCNWPILGAKFKILTLISHLKNYCSVTRIQYCSLVEFAQCHAN